MPTPETAVAGRLRKAWEVRIEGYDDVAIIYAPTAGKARSDAWRQIDDSSTRIVDVVARRASWRDVVLPDREPIADEISDKARHCLMHAFGGNDDPIKAGYRSYYYTICDDPPLVELSRKGLMWPDYRNSSAYGEITFHMTARGKRVALSLVPEYRK